MAQRVEGDVEVLLAADFRRSAAPPCSSPASGRTYPPLLLLRAASGLCGGTLGRSIGGIQAPAAGAAGFGRAKLERICSPRAGLGISGDTGGGRKGASWPQRISTGTSFGRRLGGFLENFISQISSYGAQAWVSKNFISLRPNGDEAFFFYLEGKI